MIAFLFLVGISLIFTGMGWWSWKRPRPRINPLIGYRTRRSMKSQAAWDFAQVYSGKVMHYTGLVMLVLALLAFVPFQHFFKEDSLVAVMSLMVAPMVAASVLPLYLTEKKLKQLFDKEGNPIK